MNNKEEVSEECLAALRAASEVIGEKCPSGNLGGVPIEKEAVVEKSNNPKRRKGKPWILRKSKKELFRILEIFTSEKELVRIKKEVEEGNFKIKDEELPKIYALIDRKIEEDRLEKREEVEEQRARFIHFKTPNNNYSFIIVMGTTTEHPPPDIAWIKEILTTFDGYITNITCAGGDGYFTSVGLPHYPALCGAKFNEIPEEKALNLLLKLKSAGLQNIIIGRPTVPTVALFSCYEYFTEEKELKTLLTAPDYPVSNIICGAQEDYISLAGTLHGPEGLDFFTTICVGQYAEGGYKELDEVFKEKLRDREILHIVVGGK